MIDSNDIDDTDFFEFMSELRELAIEVYSDREQYFIRHYYDIMEENDLRPGVDILIVPEKSMMCKYKKLIPKEVRSRIKFSDTMRPGTYLTMRAQ